MYKNFFGLARNPFDLSPDPHFLVPTPRHCDAIASLYWGVQQRKGFSVLTGEVGTGKTLVLRCLFRMLKRNNVSFAYLFHPKLTCADFLGYIAADLGLTTQARTKGELLWQLNSFIVARNRENSTVALIVDEAQLLDYELLEEVRLLTNLETAQHKLLQVILVGQPELDRKLDSDELRQLKQRVAFRCRLEPLSEKDTQLYIARRLATAGAKDVASAFSDEALHHIWIYSHGIPRLINNICENVLINAYARQSRPATPEVVHEVARDLRLGVNLGQKSAPGMPSVLSPLRASALGQS